MPLDFDVQRYHFLVSLISSMMPLDSDVQRFHQTEPMQILQKVVDLRTVNCSQNLQCLPFAHGSSSRCRRCRSNHCCSWSRCCPTRPSVSTVATRPDVYVYINITTGLNSFGRWFVYIQTIYKQESLARHFKCGQKICRAEDYTPNYIFFKRGTS